MRLRNIPRAEEVIASSEMVVQEPKQQKGRWHELFGNHHPIHIEVGMGKGKFITTLAKLHPEINYIGIERYTSVLLRAVEKLEGCETEKEEEGEKNREEKNLYFLCMDAADLPEVFDTGEVNKIYLNFSDPWPKARHARRRLTSRQFLARYDQILSRDGRVEFKTDNRALFDFALEEVKPAGWELELCTYDLHGDGELMKENIMTEYEEKFSALGNPIHKMVISRQSSCII